MKKSNHTIKSLAVAITAALILASCASTPPVNERASAVRSKLIQLQSDPQLASQAPIEIRDADIATSAAEKPERNLELNQHLVLIADEKVDIARLWAQSRLYESQRKSLSEASEQARLDSRTREADLARRDAAIARNAAVIANSETDAARSATAAANSEADAARYATVVANNETDAARNATALANNETDAARSDTRAAQNQTDNALQAADNARAEKAELQRQVVILNARETDRGFVVTLGDVLFETGKSALLGADTNNLGKLSNFLTRYPDRNVSIEGHTDNVGTENSNQVLSQNRATVVKDYLVGQGISSNRIQASGKGEDMPVSSNDTATGRQQNRRVEVIIASK